MKKCTIVSQQVVYLGRNTTTAIISLDPEKVCIVETMPISASANELAMIQKILRGLRAHGTL